MVYFVFNENVIVGSKFIFHLTIDKDSDVLCISIDYNNTVNFLIFAIIILN